MTDNEDLAYWLALNKTNSIGARRFVKLVKYFGSAKAAWEASPKEMREIEGFSEILSKGIAASRKEIDPWKELEEVEKEGIDIITLRDERYPYNLTNIFDPPPVLYVKGEFLPEDKNSIAIVGTRRPTPYGLIMAEKLSIDLADNKFTIVSGMARGIDSTAHQGALRRKGRTIAVLGCGIDVVYPRGNERLMQEICSSGAVISEFPLGTKPDPYNFPPRNRIISGLSLGVIIIQAGRKSGALITADLALEQGREVFVIPGNVNVEKSRGTNNLIKQGAILVEDVNDVLEELGFTPEESQRREKIASGLSEEERKVYELITDEPQHIDQLAVDSGIAVQDISSILTLLDIKGLIRQIAGMRFMRM